MILTRKELMIGMNIPSEILNPVLEVMENKKLIIWDKETDEIILRTEGMVAYHKFKMQEDMK